MQAPLAALFCSFTTYGGKKEGDGNLWRKEGREGVERKVREKGREEGREGRGHGSKIPPQ